MPEVSASYTAGSSEAEAEAECTEVPRWNVPVHCCAPVYSPTSPRQRLGEMSPIHGRAAQSSYGLMQIVDKTAGSGGRQPYRVCAVADAY
jgi:hypothetical protein